MDPNLPVSSPYKGLHIRLIKEIRKYKPLFFIAVFAGLLSSLAGIGGAWNISLVVDKIFLGGESFHEIQWLLLVLLILVTTRSFMVWIGEKFAGKLAILIKTNFRERLYTHFLELGPAYTQGYQTGALTNLLVDGMDALEAYYSQYLPQAVFAVLIPLLILACVIPVDPLSGLVLLLTAPIIPVFMVLIANISSNLTQRQWKNLSRMSAFFLDILQGLTTLKILGRSRDRSKAISQVSERYRQITMSVLRVTFLSALVMELTATLSTALVAVEIGLRLLSGKMEFGPAFFILILVPEFYLPLRLLGLRFHSGMAGAAAARQIFEVLDQSSRNETFYPKEEPEKKDQLGMDISIRYENVSFSYSPGEPTLRDISFEIKPGQSLAVIGPSGAGKSTLASLLLRFYKPDRGRILVGEDDIQSIPYDRWLRNVAWVPQKPYLFSDTITENIRLARPDASLEDVKKAAHLAHADGFIEELENGYETQMGERGIRLSGGQIQRIALARAFLKNAPLLILDEPTANLDPDLETLLQNSIQKLVVDKMVLVIAHRLSTVSKADHILVLDEGRIVESGNHHELLERKGLYHRMVMSGGFASQNELGEQNSIEDKTSWEFQPNSSGAGENLEIPYLREQGRDDSRKKYPLFHLIKLLKPFKGWVFLSVLLGFSAILCGIGLLSTSAFIISAAALHPSIAALQVAIVGVRFFGIFRGISRYLERVTSHQVTFKLLAQLRVWFYQSIEPLAPARLMTVHSGDLLSRIVGDISVLENFYVRGVAPPLTAILVTISMMLFLLAFNPWLSLMSVFFLAIGGILLPLVSLNFSKEAGAQAVQRRAQLSISLIDGIQGLADLTVFTRLAQYKQVIKTKSRTLSQADEQISKLNAVLSGLLNFNANIALWTVLIFGSWSVQQGMLNPVLLGVICLAVLASFEAVQPLPQVVAGLRKDVEAAKRLLVVVEPEPVIMPSVEYLLEPKNYALEVKRLSFSYPSQLENQLNRSDSLSSLDERNNLPSEVLSDISFSVKPGEHIAIVGPSGAGKSTLVSLLMRFWDYKAGNILFGGKEIHLYAPESLRRWLNVISQSPYLFSGTIRENLLLAKPDAAAAELDHAILQAHLQDFIASLPDGLQTWIGEQGLRISAGERQRLILARAFLRDAPVLILDEATSNLDSLLEQKILAEIQRFCLERARLTITHRLVGLEEANEILVLNHGKIVERGSHSNLLAENGLYSRMWRLQNLPRL
jgi:ATP-binding cassette subfamily C protein CydCD